MVDLVPARAAPRVLPPVLLPVLLPVRRAEAREAEDHVPSTRRLSKVASRIRKTQGASQSHSHAVHITLTELALLASLFLSPTAAFLEAYP